MTDPEGAFLERIDAFTGCLERWMLIVLLVAMIVLGMLQIISRFVIRSPIMWSEALLMYMVVWSSFIGASLAVRESAHFEVEIFVVHLPPVVQKVLAIGVYVTIFLFSVFLIDKGIFLVKLNQRQLMALLPFTMSWPYLILPLSGTLMAIHSLRHIGRLSSRQCSEWGN